MSYGVSLLALDILYLFTQSLTAIIGWLFSDYLDLAFVCLASFMFFGILFLMFSSVIYGYYTPDLMIGSVYRLILVRVLLVWFWLFLQTVSLVSSVIGWGYSPRGGWGGRGDRNVNRKGVF
jgi:hypothetical protein